MVSDAVDAFNARWDTSTTQEGGVSAAILDRFLDGLTGPFETAIEQPTFGYGLGMGTNVGAKLLVGESRFPGRRGPSGFDWFLKWGLLLASCSFGVRIAIVLGMARFAIHSWRQNNPAPFLFLSVAALPILQAQWGQPTSLGFTVLAGGLVLAAGRVPRSEVHDLRIGSRLGDRLRGPDAGTR